VNLAYSARNRSAAIRIPMFSTNPKLKRLEFRPPDLPAMPTWHFQRCCWPDWMGFRIESIRASRWKGHLRSLTRGTQGRPHAAGIMDESLKALEADHDFLLKGDVFSPQLIERWIAYNAIERLHRCGCGRTRSSFRFI